MFVRRMATVTICAPDASIASRVCAKSRYFPVPTRRRERYARPAMTSGWARTSCSAGAFMRLFYACLSPADGRDDLETVAGGDARLRIAALGDDFAVHLDRDALALEVECAHEFGDGRGRRVEAMRGAIERQLHDSGIIARRA